MNTTDSQPLPTDPNNTSIPKARAQKFKFYRFVLNETQTNTRKTLHLRNYRISSYSIPSSSSQYFPLPKKECFKLIRRFSLSFHGSSSWKNAKETVKMVKKKSITNLEIFSGGYYYLTPHISSLQNLRSPSNVSELCFKVDVRSLYHNIMSIFSQILLKSKNLKRLRVEFQSCHIASGVMKEFIANLSAKPKLRELVFNLLSSGFNDQGLLELTEALMKNLPCLASLIVCLRGNYNISNKGTVYFGTAIEKSKSLRDLYLNILNTGVNAAGHKNILDSIMQNQDLKSFHLYPCEVPTIKSFLIDFLESRHGLSKMDFCGVNMKDHAQDLQELQEVVKKLPRLEKYQENVDNLSISFIPLND